MILMILKKNMPKLRCVFIALAALIHINFACSFFPRDEHFNCSAIATVCVINSTSENIIVEYCSDKWLIIPDKTPLISGEIKISSGDTISFVAQFNWGEVNYGCYIESHEGLHLQLNAKIDTTLINTYSVYPLPDNHLYPAYDTTFCTTCCNCALEFYDTVIVK